MLVAVEKAHNFVISQVVDALNSLVCLIKAFTQRLFLSAHLLKRLINPGLFSRFFLNLSKVGELSVVGSIGLSLPPVIYVKFSMVFYVVNLVLLSAEI